MSRRMTPSEVIALGGREVGTKKPAVKGRRSNLESDLEAQLRLIGLHDFETDYRFHSVREWKLDIAWPDLRFAIEVDGTIKSGQGGHQTTEGMTEDYQKQCEAMFWGWQIMRCTGPMVKSGEAADFALRLITRRAKEYSQDNPAIPHEKY